MKEGIYLVRTQSYTFEMHVIHYGTTFTIKYGDPSSREGPCIEITYDTNRESTASLDNLAYYTRCSYDKDLEKRKGTHEMLRSVLKILAKSFPTIKRVILKDVSAFNCNGRDVWLSYYGILVDGETWYEKHFGAKPLDRHIKEPISKFKQLLSTRPKNGVFPFVKSISQPFDTWHEYFRTKDCTYFLQHMGEIERSSAVKLVYSSWYIPVNKILDYDINILSVKRVKRSRKIISQNGGSIGLVVTGHPDSLS